MRLLFEPQAKYRPTSHKPSRPYLPKKKRLVLQVISDPETPNEPIENKQPPSSPPFTSKPKPKPKPKSNASIFSKSSTKMTELLEDQPEKGSSPPPTLDTTVQSPIPEPTSYNLIANLSTEASRLEIGLLALGILVLVAQMGALIWLGVRRRRKSAQWHHAETQIQTHQEDDSRFSSTAGLCFRSPFSDSGAVAGAPTFWSKGMARGGESSWGRLKGKFRGGHGGGVKSGGGGESVDGGEHCLFDDVFPAMGSEGEESGLGEKVGNAGHHHGLVLGPPTVTPVISSSSQPAAAAATVTAAVSGLMEAFRRRSSAIWAENIVPPVQVQMEVLTEIGRRMSVGLQAARAGAVLGGGGKGDGGYVYADEELSDEGHSMTPPEERYHKDLEVGIGAISSTAGGSGVAAATSSDANDNRRFSLMAGLVSIPGDGLVRRTGLHVGKRVSFVEGLVSTPRAGGSGSGGALLGNRRRHSSFVFDRRGDDEIGVGEGDGEEEAALEYGFNDREVGREVV